MKTTRAAIVVLFALLSVKSQAQLSVRKMNPPAQEFRGVWIATVDNIDWPLKGMVNVDSQKAELRMHSS